MKEYCYRWSRLGLASSRQMKAKIEGVKDKYDAGAEEVAKFYGNEKEFELWMKIDWGKEAGGSGGDGDKDKDKDEGGCS
ncbi:hypothetical protein OSB04_015379 [Centaurea solstitialis]|uniref:Uncharacterized protein n=1 Tax=Centaurea solstitialis TaxID=347529 RepID=A0AA38T0I8_9ASTR|nr:hypothetical protein OSB04_015379 [Centaurea solstitialis]